MTTFYRGCKFRSLSENEDHHRGVEDEAGTREEAIFDRPCLRSVAGENAGERNATPEPPTRRIRLKPCVVHCWKSSDRHSECACDDCRLWSQFPPTDGSDCRSDCRDRLNATPVPHTPREKDDSDKGSTESESSWKPRPLVACCEATQRDEDIQNCPHDPTRHVLWDIVDRQVNGESNNSNGGNQTANEANFLFQVIPLLSSLSAVCCSVTLVENQRALHDKSSILYDTCQVLIEICNIISDTLLAFELASSH